MLAGQDEREQRCTGFFWIFYNLLAHPALKIPRQRQQLFFHFAAGVTTGQTACGTATGSQAWENV